MATIPVVTVRLEPDLRKRLDRLAKAQRRSRSYVATEAIREYVKVNEWQILETQKALAEADRGEFASPEDVRRVFKKWTRPKRRGRAR
jgi:predicted transcriptional regulator